MLIVEPLPTVEEFSQGQGVRGLREPEHSLDVELLDALASDPESLADDGEGLGRGAIEPVVGDDDLAQAAGKPADETTEFSPNLGLVKLLARIGALDRLDRQRRQQSRQRQTLIVADRCGLVVLHDRSPDGTRDRHDGVAAELDASRRVVALESAPEADPTGLDGVLEG